jgi:hypothetical protein
MHMSNYHQVERFSLGFLEQSRRKRNFPKARNTIIDLSNLVSKSYGILSYDNNKKLYHSTLKHSCQFATLLRQKCYWIVSYRQILMQALL